ncbi:hypothetical protein SY94_4694 [Agrobacterium tumefaciens]|nr:hypothetical protein SY94_4694 [Agrobacterium tumefaciens]
MNTGDQALISGVLLFTLRRPGPPLFFAFCIHAR